MDRTVRNLLRLYIFLIPKFENIFGLSQFRFNIKWKLLSYSLRIGFVAFYPIICIRALKFTSDSTTTLYARNLTFAFNWMLMISIFTNESFTSDQQHKTSLKELKRFYGKLITEQDLKSNISLLLKCTLKTSILVFTLCRLSFMKYLFNANDKLTSWEMMSSLCFILCPFIILSLA